MFYDVGLDAVSQGASIVEFANDDCQRQGYEVQMIDFADFVEDLAKKEGKINFIKLDIEGAEFAVLDALIERNLCECAEYIMCETHERYFKEPEKKLKVLKDKIAKKGIKNVYLDWI